MADARARQLRQSMTRQEVKLWLHLRDMRSSGFHFRRQVPRDGYILDFACLRRGVIIEIDGGQHARGREQDRDQRRDRHFAAQGFKVLRFWNAEVDRNLEGVLQVIDEALREVRPPTPATPACAGLTDPPPLGEGLEPGVAASGHTP